MFFTTAVITTLLTSTCPNGQCFVPFRVPSVSQGPQGQTQVPPAQALPPAAVVRIANHRIGGSTLGSGTIVAVDANRSIVLTCAHLFSDGVGKLTVRSTDGQVAAARLLTIDRRWDLAALAIAPTSTIRPPPIATEAPKPGEPLSSCGYGPDGRFWINRGVARGYVQVAGTKSFETLEMTGRAREGDSGGPILNRAGQLVAVLWGSNGQVVGGTYCGRIRRFLAGVLGAGVLGRPEPPCRIEPPSSAPSPAPPFSNEPPQNIQVPVENLIPIENLGGASGAGAAGGNKTEAEESDESRIKGLLAKLGQLGGGVATVRSRLETVTDRLQRIEAVSAKIQSLGLLDGAGAGGAWLPALMAALGWTGPPSLALIIGLRLGSRLLRRRIRKRLQKKTQKDVTQAETTSTAEATEKESPRQRTLNDDYARQLAQVYALSGRSALGDVTLGREYDEELRKAEVSSDAQLAQWAGALRRRIADRFNRIHGLSPTPADPLES